MYNSGSKRLNTRNIKNVSGSTCSQFVNFQLRWPENPNNLVTRHYGSRKSFCTKQSSLTYMWATIKHEVMLWFLQSVQEVTKWPARNKCVSRGQTWQADKALLTHSSTGNLRLGIWLVAGPSHSSIVMKKMEGRNKGNWLSSMDKFGCFMRLWLSK